MQKIDWLLGGMVSDIESNHGPTNARHCLWMNIHLQVTNRCYHNQKTQSGERNLETYTLITGESDVRNVTCINELSVSGEECFLTKKEKVKITK